MRIVNLSRRSGPAAPCSVGFNRPGVVWKHGKRARSERVVVGRDPSGDTAGRFVPADPPGDVFVVASFKDTPVGALRITP
ncbi:MAG: hypothetical protein ACI9OJ_005077 [Myxococcota bacterium]